MRTVSDVLPKREVAALHLAGIVPPLVTPLTGDRTVDVHSLERLIEWQLDAGVNGVFVLGSSGEAIYLTDSERRTVVEVTTSVVAGRVPVLAGAVDASPARVIDQLHWIETYAVDAVVVTGPFYASVSEEEIVRHFELIAASTDKPVFAYDIPGNVGSKLPTGAIVHLLETGIITGLKDSSGDIATFRSIRQAVPSESGHALLTGSDILADCALSIGADGIVPGLGNVSPRLFVALFAAHCRADKKGVSDAQRSIVALSGMFAIGQRYGLGRHASELGALKHALWRRGLIATPQLSQPLTPYPPGAAAELDVLLDRHAV